MGLPIIGLIIGVAGSLVQGMMQAKAAKLQAKAQNIQLKANAEVEKIKGMEAANTRLEQYQKMEAANRVNVAINGAGTGARDWSYEQGIAPYNLAVAGKDVQNIQFNTGQEIGRIGYQIRVNKFEAKTTGRMAMIGAAVDAASQVGSFIGNMGTGTGSGGASTQNRLVAMS